MIAMASAKAGSFTYTYLTDYSQGIAAGINDAGQVAGYGVVAGRRTFSGFIWANGTSTNYDYTKSKDGTTVFTAINASGVVSGLYRATGSQKTNVAFIFTPSSGQYTLPNIPYVDDLNSAGINAAGQAIFSSSAHKEQRWLSYLVSGTKVEKLRPSLPYVQATGFSDRGVVVGGASSYPGQRTAFELKGKRYTEIAPPGSVASAANFIALDGTIGGVYYDASNASHGFLLNKGTYSVLDYPGSASSQPVGVGPQGEVVGNYVDSANKSHGYVYVDGTSYGINATFPGNTTVVVTGVNASGTLVGYVENKFEAPIPFVAACAAQQFPCTQ
jgi:hypothetical protein